MKKKVSFVIPCYRSALTLESVIAEIQETMEKLEQYKYEIILVNDCSPDNTFEVIEKLCEANKNICGINLAKNFGQHGALMAGFHQVTGDILVCLDDDGQTPANEVGKLLEKIELGDDVVYASYAHKKHSLFRNFGSFVNEKMAQFLLGKPKELYVSSYFAARRFVVNEMLKYENSYPYVIGLVLRTTKKISNVPVQHRQREIGESGYTLGKLLGLWFNGFTAFSTKPLRIATISGSAFACVGFLYGIYTVVKKLINPAVPVGFSSLMSALLFIGGVMLLMLGLIGEYIGRMYICMNNAPQFVVRDLIPTKQDEKMIDKPKMQNVEKIASVIVGGLGTIALSNTLSFVETTGEAVPYTNSFTAFLLGVLSSVLLWQISRKADRRDTRGWILSWVYSFLLSFALTVGKQLETVENWNVFSIGPWINIILLSVFFCPFVKIAWEWMGKYWKQKSCRENACQGLETGTKEQRIRFLRDWLLIFLCWLPVFLAFYPGAFVYDAQDEYVQVATRTFTTHHPLTHVLLLGGFVCGGNKFFGSYNIGIALYTLFQMLVLSAVFSYTIVYIRRKIESKWAEILPVLFYGLFPVISMYAVCSAKDGLFTAAFLVIIIQMLQFFEAPESYLSKKRNVIAGILAAGVCMLFRNNGVYAYVVWAVLAALVLLFWKTSKKTIGKFLGITGTGVILFFITSQLLSFVCQATPGGKQEMLTVPIQQMVRTYVYSPESYSEEEKEILYEILPEEELQVYNPRLSDIIKSKFNNDNFGQKPTRYLSLWARVGCRNPLTYLNAWFMTSYGYWYPDAVINVYGGNAVHTFTYQDSSYFGFETEPPGVRESKLPVLEEFYRKLSLELYQQKVPVISMLFSPGFLFWVYAFVMFYLLWQIASHAKKDNFRKFLPLLLVFILWLTVIIGPTYLVRYVLILWFALPLFVTETKV